jgi:uncharacterized protein (TIGR02646 family)
VISNNRKATFPIPQSLINATDEIQRIAETMDKEAIKPTIYKGERTINGKKIHEVRDALKKIYHNKCAYCEKIEHKPEIEHYRPKKRVAEDKPHNGYYWLCYEWTNLIPSCRYCNTEGGKYDKFPIIGNRVTTPNFMLNRILDFDACKADNSPLIDEQPYLFHPEIDVSIESNFEFLDNGVMRGTDHQGRGRQTIRTCNLNRDNLLKLRQTIIDGYFKRIKNQLKLYLDNEMSFQLLKKQLLLIFLKIQISCKAETPFSALSKYIQNHFNLIIVPLFPTPKQRLIVQNAYRKFQNGTLVQQY